jgi:hypothetical protein
MPKSPTLLRRVENHVDPAHDVLMMRPHDPSQTGLLSQAPGVLANRAQLAARE